jgi:hypothetical protein
VTTCLAMCVYQQVHPVTAACVNSILELPNFGMAMVRGCPNIDIARAMVVKKALDNPRVTRILFIDSDVAFGVEQIKKLLSHDVPIVGLPYCNRHTANRQYSYFPRITSPLGALCLVPAIVRYSALGVSGPGVLSFTERSLTRFLVNTYQTI